MQLKFKEGTNKHLTMQPIVCLRVSNIDEFQYN